MSRISGGRGLLMALLVLVLLAGIVDVLRPESLILGTLRGAKSRPQTPAERAVEEFQERREVPLPASKR